MKFYLLDNILRYAALLADDGKIRPMYLKWNLETYQDITANFWRNQGDCKVDDYINDFQFTTWRHIRNKYHIERFEYPVNEWNNYLLRNNIIDKKETWILFDYSSAKIIKQVVLTF